MLVCSRQYSPCNEISKPSATALPSPTTPGSQMTSKKLKRASHPLSGLISYQPLVEYNSYQLQYRMKNRSAEKPENGQSWDLLQARLSTATSFAVFTFSHFTWGYWDTAKLAMHRAGAESACATISPGRCH